MLEKLVLAIQFMNSFAEEPVATREEAFHNCERVNLPRKVSSAVWPGHLNYNEYISEDSVGNMHLRSVDEDNTAELVLSKNGFHFTLTYLYLLPFKKPQW